MKLRSQPLLRQLSPRNERLENCSYPFPSFFHPLEHENCHEMKSVHRKEKKREREREREREKERERERNKIARSD